MDAFIKLLRDDALYTSLVVESKEAFTILNRIEFRAITFDTYCPGCAQWTTWRNRGGHTNETGSRSANGALTRQTLSVLEEYLSHLALDCARNSSHTAHFCLEISDVEYAPNNPSVVRCFTLQKFGQLPALADVAASDLDEYKDLIEEADLRELKRATGLAAHGIGIGSFVYLRRIFERMVEEAAERANKANGLDLGTFSTMRMEDKLQAVKGFVPDWMVENRKLYSILSLGLHELTEASCQTAFPAVKAAIISLLEQHAEAVRRERRAQQAATALTDLQRALSAKK